MPPHAERESESHRTRASYLCMPGQLQENGSSSTPRLMVPEGGKQAQKAHQVFVVVGVGGERGCGG